MGSHAEGTDLRRLRLDSVPGDHQLRQRQNNPLDTGFGYANAALGIFSSFSQQAKFIEGHWIYDSVEGYLQDNWKLSERLTLDYGVRITHQGPNYDMKQQPSNFFPKATLPRYSPSVSLTAE